MDQLQKWLVITEKPSVAGDIAKALGGFEKKQDFYESPEYIITWAVGHLLELLAPEDIDPKYKRWLIQDLPIIPGQFEYKPKDGQKERLENIKGLSRKPHVMGLINACDAGREGELIFREVFDYCKQKKPIRRLWLQSMTAEAIRKEFKSVRDGAEFDNLGDAARCRSESDWLIGMNATRAMTRRLATRAKRGEAWSIGRVQTPTLALVVKREMEILKHRPEPYWTIEGIFSTPTHEYAGQWFDPKFKKPAVADDDESSAVREKDDRIFSKADLDKIWKEIQHAKDSATATETRKESKEIAPQLFDLTTLQREANRRFGMPASRTLQAAQRLYEKHKLVTYPRTDSRYLPEDYQPVVAEILKKNIAGASTFGNVCKKIQAAGLRNQDRVFNNKYISDHFAIIPTGELPSGTLEGDDARIFDLIMKRFLAAFMPNAVWAKVERITKIGNQHFRTRVQDLQEPGWREVYGLDTEEESRLPKLDGANGTPTKVTTERVEEPKLGQTKPAPRLTEAKLLSLMEHAGRSIEDEDLAEALKEKGIGTVATRAEIIENLIAKEYVQRVGKALKPTAKGIRLVDIVSRIPVTMLASVELTGEMEHQLKLMEKGRKSRAEFMKEMIGFTTEIVEKTKGFDYNELYAGDAPLGSCPACHKGEVVESFWSYRCTNDKECEFIIWKEKNQRFIDRSLVADVLATAKVGPLDFMTSSGTPYQAWLGVTEKGLSLFDENGQSLEAPSAADAKVLSEQFLDETHLGLPGKIIETEVAYFCEFGKKDADPAAEQQQEETPKRKSRSKKAAETTTEAKPVKKKKPPRKLMARMPRVLCSHPVSLDEFKAYITSGSTPPILDFKSKKGRPFGASLHLKPDGSFEFRFVSRKKAEPKEGEEGEAKETKKRTKTTTRKAKVVKKVAAES